MLFAYYWLKTSKLKTKDRELLAIIRAVSFSCLRATAKLLSKSNSIIIAIISAVAWINAFPLIANRLLINNLLTTTAICSNGLKHLSSAFAWARIIIIVVYNAELTACLITINSPAILIIINALTKSGQLADIIAAGNCLAKILWIAAPAIDLLASNRIAPLICGAIENWNLFSKRKTLKFGKILWKRIAASNLNAAATLASTNALISTAGRKSCCWTVRIINYSLAPNLVSIAIVNLTAIAVIINNKTNDYSSGRSIKIVRSEAFVLTVSY